MAFDGDAASFRHWLVQKVKGSSWSTRRDHTLEIRAQRLGVQPDILQQAQDELNAESKKAGVVAVEVGTGHTHASRVSKIMLTLEMPVSVFEDWGVYCSEQPLSPTAIMRSVVHTLLVSGERPTWVGKGWIYRNKRLKLEGYTHFKAKSKPWPYRARCDITHGARTALMRRAQSYGAKPTGLVRGAVIDLLEGRTQRLQVAHSLNSMWDDPGRYGHPDSEQRKAEL